MIHKINTSDIDINVTKSKQVNNNNQPLNVPSIDKKNEYEVEIISDMEQYNKKKDFNE